LPVVPRRPGHWVALGYRGTASVGGGADILTTGGGLFRFGHRHHFAVQGVAGRRARLAYGAGLGIAAFAFDGRPHDAAHGGVLAVELEGRIGYVFGADPSLAQGIFGAKVRLSGAVADGFVPFPNLGLFIGVHFGNGLPAPPTRRAAGSDPEAARLVHQRSGRTSIAP